MKRISLEDLRTGDIALTSGNSTLADMIEKFQSLQDNAKESSKYSHSGIIRVQDELIFITEAQKRGICNNDFVKRYMNANYDSLMILRPKVKIDPERMESEMMPYIGNSKYDYFDLLILQPIKIIFGKWLGEKKQNSKKFICHEFTAFTYNQHFYNNPVIFEKETAVNSKDIFDNKNFEHYILK